MKRKTIINLVIFFVLITSMVIFYKYDTGKVKNIEDQLNKEFPSITIAERVSGVVSDVYNPYPGIFRKNPHLSHILLNGSTKKRIRTGNELTTSASLDSLLRVGDLLIKKHGSDTLFICKIKNGDTLKYSFQLRDDQGYPIRKKQ